MNRDALARIAEAIEALSPAEQEALLRSLIVRSKAREVKRVPPPEPRPLPPARTEARISTVIKWKQ